MMYERYQSNSKYELEIANGNLDVNGKNSDHNYNISTIAGRRQNPMLQPTSVCYRHKMHFVTNSTVYYRRNEVRLIEEGVII